MDKPIMKYETMAMSKMIDYTEDFRGLLKSLADQYALKRGSHLVSANDMENAWDDLRAGWIAQLYAPPITEEQPPVGEQGSPGAVHEVQSQG